MTDFGAKGLSWSKLKMDGRRPTFIGGGLGKFFSPEQQKQLIERFGAKDGDLLLLVADKEAAANKALAPLRCRVGRDLKLYDPGTFEFVWVVNFPLFDWNADEKRYDSMHHPFTAPVPEDLGKLDTDPLHIRSQAYDIVAQRQRDRRRQHSYPSPGGAAEDLRPAEHHAGAGRAAVRVLPEGARLRRPAARRHRPGPRPAHHAPDRTDNIRDVIAFPKTQRGQCLLTDAPSEVDQKQLDELNLRVQKHAQAIEDSAERA